MMHRILAVVFAPLAVGAALLLTAAPAQAAPSGAIFTTTADGAEVNANIYPSKEAVYLDGGPGIGAPATAAGLPDGTYVFMVTDPSGKNLLSTDAARCRQFTVVGGLITGVVPAGGCEHATGVDIDHGAATVQLMPYLDTPNNGGVYKAWATPVQFYQCNLSLVDCGKGKHGFLPSESKTDNFKVKKGPPREIDVWFMQEGTGEMLPGFSIVWTDTLGASNVKWSYLVEFWGNVEAHVEAVEIGTHLITISDQPGCTVGVIKIDDKPLPTPGPQTIEVTIKPPASKLVSTVITVICAP